jgi:hypothetical protein
VVSLIQKIRKKTPALGKSIDLQEF